MNKISALKKGLRVIAFGTLIGIFASAHLPSAQAFARKPKKEERSVTTPLPVTPSIYTLLDCYQLALKRSEVVAISKESIEETEAEFLKASGEVLGDVDFLITDFRQERVPSTGSSDGSSSVGGSLTRDHRRERKFVITQPIFQGFRSIAAIGAAGGLRKQRTEEWRRAQELLFQDAANAFYNVLKYKQEVQILNETLKALEERVRELYEREKIGRSRPSETASALSRKKILEAELARSQGALAVSYHILEFLIGEPANHLTLDDKTLPDTPQLELEDYLGSSDVRPDVQAALYAAKTAWQGVIEAQSDLWPELTLDSNIYEKREGFQKDIDWDVLLSVNVPLSRGGTTLGNLKQAVSKWKKAKLGQSLAKRQADLNIQETYQNWKASVENFNALENAVQASQANFDFQKDEYSKNLVSNLEVLEAIEELNDTRRQANESYYQMKEKYWQLQVATGRIHDLI